MYTYRSMVFPHNTYIACSVAIWAQVSLVVAEVFSAASMVLPVADDFADDDQGINEASSKPPTAGGKKRPWLRVFETLPAQMLNAYGPAKFAKMSDADVWQHFSTPLKSGAMYMTELCSKEEERRGIGINRWLHAVKVFCEHQKEPGIKKANEALLAPKKFSALYEEIDRILPSLVYCLAPQKPKVKSGASSLRSSGIQSNAVGIQKEPAELCKHAKVLYDSLDTSNVSRVRMLLHWHSAAGLSYVAAVHHRAAQCFRYEGNSLHGSRQVTLEDFQACITNRHQAGSSGIPTEDTLHLDLA